MLAKVQMLKERKEKDRQVFVNEQEERRFKENTDELRKVDIEFKEL
jgi:hypothetical protein